VTKPRSDSTSPDVALAVLAGVEDCISDDEAEEYARQAIPTADQEQWAHSLDIEIRARLAALKRLHTPVGRHPRPASSIPIEIVALSREQLIARLQVIVQAANVQYASLAISTMSEDDLRRLLWTLEAPRKE
jgi:hypothetical protein